MIKNTALIFLNIFIGLTLNAQYQQMDLLQNNDVFLNQKLINPTFLTDSNKVHINYVAFKPWRGYFETKKGFFISGETNLSNNSLGINYDYEGLLTLKNRTLTASLKHNFRLKNNSRIDIGLNLGWFQYKLNRIEGLDEGEPFWIGNPIVNFGVAFKLKNHRLGLSCDILRTPPFGYLIRYDRKGGIIASYQGIFKITNRLVLSPELYSCFHSDEIYGILAIKLNYLNKFFCGILYNTKTSNAIHFSTIILKRIKLGYSYSLISKIYMEKSHALNLGLIL
jgi:hypothetical protein